MKMGSGLFLPKSQSERLGEPGAVNPGRALSAAGAHNLLPPGAGRARRLRARAAAGACPAGARGR